MGKTADYRVVQREDTSLAIIFVTYEDDAKTRIECTSNPDEAIGIYGMDIDGLRVEIAKVAQALEAPVLGLHHLPGSDSYVNPDEEPLPTAFTETVSSPGSIDDGSAPEVPDNPGEDEGTTTTPEPEGDSDGAEGADREAESAGAPVEPVDPEQEG